MELTGHTSTRQNLIESLQKIQADRSEDLWQCSNTHATLDAGVSMFASDVPLREVNTGANGSTPASACGIFEDNLCHTAGIRIIPYTLPAATCHPLEPILQTHSPRHLAPTGHHHPMRVIRIFNLGFLPRSPLLGSLLSKATASVSPIMGSSVGCKGARRRWKR